MKVKMSMLIVASLFYPWLDSNPQSWVWWFPLVIPSRWMAWSLSDTQKQLQAFPSFLSTHELEPWVICGSWPWAQWRLQKYHLHIEWLEKKCKLGSSLARGCTRSNNFMLFHDNFDFLLWTILYSDEDLSGLWTASRWIEIGNFFGLEL